MLIKLFLRKFFVENYWMPIPSFYVESGASKSLPWLKLVEKFISLETWRIVVILIIVIRFWTKPQILSRRLSKYCKNLIDVPLNDESYLRDEISLEFVLSQLLSQVLPCNRTGEFFQRSSDRVTFYSIKNYLRLLMFKD